MMSTSDPTPGQAAGDPEDGVCRRTGLSKPECHCQDCLRDLVARFAPGGRA